MSNLEIFMMILLGMSSGFSKMGIPTALVFSPILASIYGGKLSQGIIILSVVVSDFTMIYLYRKNIDKKLLLKILPMTMLGILIGVIFEQNISDEVFKGSMGIIILGIGILTLLKKLNINFKKLSFLFGILGGFSSFIGNVSGPLMSIYLLNIKLGKEKFYSTRSWFYFIVNFTKLILYFFVSKNLNSDTIARGLVSIPSVFLGIFVGRIIVGKMNQNVFEKFIVIVSILSGAKLVWDSGILGLLLDKLIIFKDQILIISEPIINWII